MKSDPSVIHLFDKSGDSRSSLIRIGKHIIDNALHGHPFKALWIQNPSFISYPADSQIIKGCWGCLDDQNSRGIAAAMTVHTKEEEKRLYLTITSLL